MKLHLPVSPYRCVPSVAGAQDYSYRLHTEGDKPIGEGFLEVTEKCWGMVGNGGHFIQPHNNVQERTACD